MKSVKKILFIVSLGLASCMSANAQSMMDFPGGVSVRVSLVEDAFKTPKIQFEVQCHNGTILKEILVPEDPVYTIGKQSCDISQGEISAKFDSKDVTAVLTIDKTQYTKSIAFPRN